MIFLKNKTVFFLFGLIIVFYSIRVCANDINILSEDEKELIIEFVLPKFEIKGNYIQISGLANTTQIGDPELPVKSFLLQLPLTEKIDVNILENDQETISDCFIKPVYPHDNLENKDNIYKYGMDYSIYSSPNFFPEVLAKIDSKGIFRGTHFIRLMVYPFQWNPLTKELRYSKKLKLKISFENPLPFDISHIRTSKIHSEQIYDQIKNNIFLNKKRIDVINNSKNTSYLSQSSQNFQEGIRIEIKEEGIYRLKYNDIKALGVELSSVVPKTFQMFNKGEEIAIKVVSKEQFGEGDYIEFFAQGLNNQFTDTNIYWLYWNYSDGKRMTAIDGTTTEQAQKQNTFYDNIHIEENLTMWEMSPGAPDKDYWFWEKMNGQVTSNYSLSIPYPVSDEGKALIRVCFQGRSNPDITPNHHTIISLNDIEIGNDKWSNDIEFIQEKTFSSNILKDGKNILTVKSPSDTGAPVDLIYYNWADINYLRYMKAFEDKLKFAIEGNNILIQPNVSGFSQSDINIYDITDPVNVKEVNNSKVETENNSYKYIFEDQINTKKTFYMIGSSKINQTAKISLWHCSDLKNKANSADYIVISAKEFLSSIEPLCDLRKNQGLKVKSAAVEDIYNEFNYGIFDPKAIKEFLILSYQNWVKPAPTYVLLAGDANTDYRDYFKTGKKTKVPTHLVFSDNEGLRPDDNWYVCFEGNDPLPEMLIGRISGTTADMISQVVSKIIVFEKSKDKPKEVLLSADNNETYFETSSEALVKYIPFDYLVNKVYLTRYQNAGDARKDMSLYINKGQKVVNYIGHGNVKIWAGEPLFESLDIALLNNSGNRLTFAISMSCLNGYFSHPYYYCLSEELITVKDKGAIGCFSTSGSSYQWENDILNKEIFLKIFDKKNYTLGAIAAESKTISYSKGMSENSMNLFHLLGDPASKLMDTGVYIQKNVYFDFNGDRLTDILWRHKLNGKVAIWLINGTTIQSSDITASVEDLNWEIINTGDFNGDGKTDILWRHKLNGKVAVWLMNSTSIQSYDITGIVEDLNWEIINTGDFNGDGKTDILWRHKLNGKVAVWLMNGTTIQSYDITGVVEDLNWEIINAGDFNGDGKTDILWRHKLNGKVAVWLMNGTTIQFYDITGVVEDLNWEIINAGDFNGDGKTDILWKHKLNGKVAVWLMNGTTIQSYDITGIVEDLNWEIINTGDFNGDGKTDILWRHKLNGKVAIWLINGTSIQSYDITGVVEDLNWEIINAGDFNGDGKTDILWRHKLNGKVAIWLINGTSIQSYDITGIVEDLNWDIIYGKHEKE